MMTISTILYTTLYILLSITVVVIYFILKRAAKYPEKSIKHSIANVLLTPMRYFKLKPFEYGELTLDQCLKWALKRAKCSDFGDPTNQFVQNYRYVLDSDEHKKQEFTNIGYISYKMEMTMTFARRLKLVQYLKQHPSIEKVPVIQPVFVIGLPRTGTTMLYRLLSLDTKRCRGPLLWELLDPVPKIGIDANTKDMNDDREKRAKRIRKLIEVRKGLGDRALEHIHEIGADLPEECIMALNDTLPVSLSLLYSGYMKSSLYTDGNHIQIGPGYLWYKKYLQLLSAQTGEADNPKSWMLKCPFHLFNVKEIAAAFPDAKLIWTHRHPISAVPSLCSLLKAVHQIYYEKDGRDDVKLGKAVSDTSEEILLKCTKDIEQHKLQCSHILFENVVKAPLDVIKEIYSNFNWEFTKEYEAAIVEYLQQNNKERDEIKKRKGKGKGKEVLHSYTPEEFGLTEEALSSGKYKEYVDMFKIPLSRN